MATAADRGWGPGWPAAQTDKIVTLRRSDGVALPVRREVAPMVAWLCDETERRGYDLRPGQCWGFANRPIRGTLTASNHSWGLAVDLNAPANPMGDRLVTDMPAWMPALWAEHGWGWGGNYTRRPDAMHYEYLRTPADVAAWRPPSTPQEVKAMFPNHRFVRIPGDPVRFYSWDPADSSVYAWNGAPGPVLSAQGQAKIRAAGGIRDLAYVADVGLSAVVGNPGDGGSWATWNFRDLGPGDRG